MRVAILGLALVLAGGAALAAEQQNAGSRSAECAAVAVAVPDVQALEQRIAALEARIAELESASAGATPDGEAVERVRDLSEGVMHRFLILVGDSKRDSALPAP